MDLSEWLVLLIDDEADIREVTGLALQDAGYRVISAADGRTGLSLCDSRHPQLVITDIRMPGMDGLEVLEEIKRHHPQTEVIVATAFAEMALAVRALQLDASDFITKPINASALFIALERARERYKDRQKLREYTAFLEAGWAGASQALKTAYTYQKNLIENSLDGICGCGVDGRVVMVNRSLEMLLGQARDQLVGRMRLQDLFQPAEYRRFQRALERSDSGGPGRLPIFETRFTAAEAEIPVQLSAVRLAATDAPAGLVCFVRDLRELRRLEREMADHARLLHQDKMMALGRLAASVVHEINNPLAGVLNYLKLMAHFIEEGPLKPATQEKFGHYLELVINETQRCSRIISNLLAFSRKSSMAQDPVDLVGVLERCVMLSQHKLELADIRLHTQWNEDLPPVRGDANQLQQCAVNLVFNAIDAMPDGGDLYLTAAALKTEQAVAIDVRDTGGGIAPADRSLVFEPFYTTKKAGAGVGLGLSTTLGIVERHQGRLTIEDTGAQGTTFRIRLPVDPLSGGREVSP
ncbi:MAG: response regulator [Desulfosarcinaceae bacterium]|jgi:PAS domain S-box-containing protein